VTYLGDTGDLSAEFHAHGDVDTLTFRRLTYDEWTELYARHDQYRAG
jgi:hypothetical protein